MRKLTFTLLLLLCLLLLLGAVKPEGLHKIEAQPISGGARPISPGGSGPKIYLPSFPLYSNHQFGYAPTGTAEENNQYYRDQAMYDILLYQVWSMIEPPNVAAAIDSIRFYNPNIVILAYFNIHATRFDWVEIGGVLETHYDNMINNDLLLHDLNGNTPLQNSTNLSWINNRDDDAATAVSSAIISGIQNSDSFRPGMGFYFDFVDWPNFAGWPCAGGCLAVADIDRDGIAYGSDPDEQGIMQAFFDSVATKVTRELEQYHDGKIVLGANGSAYKQAAIGGKFDLAIFEGLCKLEVKSVGFWENLFNVYPGYLNKTRLNKPISYLMANLTPADTTSFYVMEALSMLNLGSGCFLPYSPRAPIRNLTHDFGQPLGDATVIDQGDDYAIATRNFEHGYAKLRVPITGTERPITNEWRYLIVKEPATVEADTLSRGGAWPRQEMWVDYDVAISSDPVYQDADSLKVNGGPYDYIANLDNSSGEFVRGLIANHDHDMQTFATTVERINYYGGAGNYWGHLWQEKFLHWFPMGDLPEFTKAGCEVLYAEYSMYWRANKTISASDTLFVVGGTKATLNWWDAGWDGCSFDYMDVVEETPWPSAPDTWVGLEAVSSLKYNEHLALNNISPVANTAVTGSLKPWAQHVADGGTNGGLWFLGSHTTGGEYIHSINGLLSTDSASERSRLIMRYRVPRTP